MSKTEILGYLKALGVFLLFTAGAGVVPIILPIAKIIMPPLIILKQLETRSQLKRPKTLSE